MLKKITSNQFETKFCHLGFQNLETNVYTLKMPDPSACEINK